MRQTDRSELASRLGSIGMVTPALAEGQPGQMDSVRDIETITGEIMEAKRVGGEAILTIGQRLIEAKALLSEGEWLPWLAEKVDFSPRTAQRFMRLASEWSDATALSYLGATKALALLALPESEREEFLSGTHRVNGGEKTVIDMTSRELERAIKERDEARKAAEQAETNVKTANDVISELEKQLAELKAAPADVAVMEADQAALDKARAEGEASKAEEVARLQDKLDRTKAAKQRADDKREDAEALVGILKLQLEKMTKAQELAAAMADPEVAKFQVYFEQVQEATNKLQGLLIKARGRDDQTTAEKLSRAMIALGDKIKGAAQ